MSIWIFVAGVPVLMSTVLAVSACILSSRCERVVADPAPQESPADPPASLASGRLPASAANL